MLLKDPASVQALQSLARILQAAWDTRADPETVADRVEAEAPELILQPHFLGSVAPMAPTGTSLMAPPPP